MLDYNVPGGKLNRGMAVADVLSAIKEGEVCYQNLQMQCCPLQPICHRTLYTKVDELRTGWLTGAHQKGALPSECSGLVYRVGESRLWQLAVAAWVLQVVSSIALLEAPACTCFISEAKASSRQAGIAAVVLEISDCQLAICSYKRSSWWLMISWTTPSRGEGSRAGTVNPL